jgi:DNA-binding response OmpR family regulator
MTRNAPVLVIDDEESHRYTTRLMLEHAGFEVQEAATGYEGLRLAGQLPAIIILDLHLPDISGIDLCRLLKASPVTARIPIINVTAAYAGSEERSQALDAGADGYLTRPLDRARLIATMEALLARRAA